MRSALRHIVAHTYKPLLVKYLSKTRVFKKGGIRLDIPPEVFHPGFFHSTQLLLNYIGRFSLKGKKLLELGAGSGYISMIAAKQGADVTATDINTTAIKYLLKNSFGNKVRLNIIHSDLFENIPAQTFDVIAINPPYYKKQPANEKEQAWFCGKDGEYFTRLFQQLPAYAAEGTEIIMVLCEGCDISLVKDAAARNGYRMDLQLSKNGLLEKDFIYSFKHTVLH